MVRNIYENFEKHKLPVRDPKQTKEILRTLQLDIPTSEAANPIIYERAKETLIYDGQYKKFNP